MITRAEQFDTIAQARARWAELERRLGADSKIDGIVVSCFLEGVPYVLFIAEDAPPSVFDGPAGTVRDDVDELTWLKLWARHEARRIGDKPRRIVVRREPGDGVRI